jgi:hypothetical protein
LLSGKSGNSATFFGAASVSLVEVSQFLGRSLSFLDAKYIRVLHPQHPGLPETSRIEIDRGRLDMRARSFEQAARPFAQG